jgi:MFS family permease
MDPNGGHDYTYRTYPARWCMLGIVFFMNCVTQVFLTTFMPIATAASMFYGVTLTAINWIALVWMALFLPCTVFAGWAMHKFGMRRCMILSGFVLLVGALIRALSGFFPEYEVDDFTPIRSKKSVAAYVVILLGSIVMGLVQPIVMSTTTLTSAAWFCEKQRNLANSIVRPALWACKRCKSEIFRYDN